MDYGLFVLALRILVGMIVAVLFAIILFFCGSLTFLPLAPGNAALVTGNLIIGVGLGAGLGGWLFGLRIGSGRNPGWYELPATLAIALTGAWLGHLVLSDLLFSNVSATRIPNANEVYGTLLGALMGAMALPVFSGTHRVLRRLEP
ncbi:MAG: hypothetical protein FJ314_01315 [SAR202 cluster bacterium]|nr:hypothetical protein [SAR202 cluster bacterium]